MNFEQFIKKIFERHASNVKLGLHRMYEILEKMDNPEKKMKGFHVGGTNGKGSTSAMLESITNSYNFSTGMNTSPHLIDYKERFRISGKKITFEEILRVYKKFENLFEKTEASFFEISTAIAFYYFYEQKLDTSIFEVGLGGQLDGTKPFKSTVSIITSIGIDHAQSLGDTIDKIAYEKCGIIKEETPVVVGNMQESAVNVISKYSKEKRSPVFIYGKDFIVKNIELTDKGTIFDFKFKNYDLKKVKLNLLGKHQAYNAACAITAHIIYFEKLGRKFSEKNLREGLNNIFWPGRMQLIETEPTVIIDGAHNEQAIKIFVENVKEIFPKKKIKVVISILRDKNIDYMIKKLGEISSKIYISKNKQDRAANVDLQSEIAEKYNYNYQVLSTVEEAKKTAVSESSKDEIIFVTGSLYTISEIIN